MEALRPVMVPLCVHWLGANDSARVHTRLQRERLGGAAWQHRFQRKQQPLVPKLHPALVYSADSLQDASITRYTVFCQHQTPLDCQLAGDLPFEFAEGPGTLNFGGTIANKM